MTPVHIVTPDLAWSARAVVPFSWKGWSKNSMWLARAGSYGTRLSPQAEASREELKLRLLEQIRGVEVRQAPLWVAIRVGRPDMKGDPVNCQDLVYDGVQLATGLDDRWYKSGGLEWEMAEEDPWLDVRIGQEGEGGTNGKTEEPDHITIGRILEVVAAEFTVSVDDIRSVRKTRRLVLPRHVAMYLTRELTGLTLAETGDHFFRDHSSVSWAVKNLGSRMEKDRFFRELVDSLVGQLRSRR